ncbi:MAG: hypothetical protein JSW71_21165 [Gemmatimonadota bacterium]|nr:MAG: hypothetical protein JSW71_21165 [Gemmatimonadota bacterium]
MKLIMMIADTAYAPEVEQMLEECDVPGFTEISNVLGRGATGKKFGSRAFPGSSTMYLAALDEHCVEPLQERLKSLRETQGPEGGLKAYTMNTEELL